MIDHAKRIAEEKRIHEMECRSKPLIIMILICLIVTLADFALDIYATKKYSEQINAADAFASCLNKVPVQIGDEWAHCKVEKLILIGGLND